MNFRLNSDQQTALEAVQRGENIFLTGPAGSGKSTLVSAIVKWAQRSGKVCDVTAMTGCAALLLGNKAKTIHSWAGVGLARGTAEQLSTDILKSPFAKKRWKRANILVIDEISMMSPDLFEKLSQVGKRVRGGCESWGGLQLILCGDFYQLPPVSKEYQTSGKFAFDAPSWKAANLCPVVLNRIERQTDIAFQNLLNEARIGRLSETSIATLKSRQGLNWKEQRIRPTLLFSRNADVDSINDANLMALDKPIHTFDATTVCEPSAEDPAAEIPKGELLERLVDRMDADSSYVPHLELCEGCQVMLVYNMDMDKGLVNGSRGVVVGFRDSDGVPIVQFLHGDPLPMECNEWASNHSPTLKRRQIPLRVAYAITIHKSQGATLDCALVDIGSSTFECGQAYVALSRVRNLESLYVWNFNPARVMADPKVTAFYESIAPTVLIDDIHIPPAPPCTPVESLMNTPIAFVASIAPIASIAPVASFTSASIAATEEADVEEAVRVEIVKEPKKAIKPRAPRKKKEVPADIIIQETPVLPTPSDPVKPTKATRKKKEVIKVLEVEADLSVDIASTPVKAAKAPRKKRETGTI